MKKGSNRPERLAAVAERLALTREAMNLNAAQFCRLTGITEPAWSNYESGARLISLDPALKVCIATGVSLDWIYRGEMSLLPVKIATDIQKLQGRKRSA